MGGLASPGSVCAARCSDLPGHGPPHTSQVMPSLSFSVCASSRLSHRLSRGSARNPWPAPPPRSEANRSGLLWLAAPCLRWKEGIPGPPAQLQASLFLLHSQEPISPRTPSCLLAVTRPNLNQVSGPPGPANGHPLQPCVGRLQPEHLPSPGGQGSSKGPMTGHKREILHAGGTYS